VPTEPYYRSALARVHHDGFGFHADGVAPGADTQVLRLPDDAVPPADAIVSVGHPVSYLDDEEQLDRGLIALAEALRPGGVLAFDVCDLEWGSARLTQPPAVWFGDDWVLVSRYSVPHERCFRRDLTTFTRRGDHWDRDDELHDNVLVETDRIPALLARHGVDAVVRSSFGSETLPVGLVAVVGRRRTD
jgi:hypothetical protein